MKRLLRSLCIAGSALTLAACLTGCAWSIGDKEGTDGPKTIRPTKGAELQDLKRAYDQGAIDEQEYKEQKQRVLDRD